MKFLRSVILGCLITVALHPSSTAQWPGIPGNLMESPNQQIQQLLEQAKASGDRGQQAYLLVTLGGLQSQLGSPQKAVEYQLEALKISREIKNRQVEDLALQSLSQTYHQLQPGSGLDFLQKQLTLAEQSQDLEGQAIVLYHLSTLHQSNNQTPLAVQTLQEMLQRSRTGQLLRQEVRALTELAEIYDRSAPQKAVELHQQCVEAAQKTGDAQLHLTSLIGLGSAQRRTGNTVKAMATYQTALQLAQQLPSIPAQNWLASGSTIDSPLEPSEAQIKILNELAYLYAQQQNLDKTEQLLQQAFTIAQQEEPSSYPEAHGTLLESLSQIYALKGDFAKAIATQQAAISAYKALNGGIESEELDSVPEEVKAAIAKARQLGTANQYEANALGRLGQFLFRAGRLAEAETTLRSALQVHQQIRQSLFSGISVLGNLPFAQNGSGLQEIQSEQNRDATNIGLRLSLESIYQTLQEVLVESNRAEAALEVAEEGRARAFADLLTLRLQQQSPKVKLGETEMSAPNLNQMRQIAQAQKSTLVQYSLLYKTPGYERLSLDYSDLYNLQERERRPSHLLIWVVQPSGNVAFRQVDLTTKLPQISLSEQVRRSRASIGTGNRGFAFQENPALVNVVGARLQESSGKNDDLRKLYEVLIEPIADLLPTDPNAFVTFVPQDSLFLVPFAALQDAQGRYLIDQHTVLTAPSIQVLELTRQKQQQATPFKGNLLIVGNPTMPKLSFQPGQTPQALSSLPGAEKEAKQIGTLLKVEPILGSKATETTVVQQMTQARLIHLATHGLLDNAFDFESAMALAPSNQADGLLTRTEIFNLRLNADLVVLSACDTGRGSISSDGVFGLSRSFIAAGVPSIVVSLWKVPDEPTSELMVEFYRQLQNGKNKAQALREAMLSTKKQYPKPSDWAAFTLIGETTPLEWR